MDDRATSVAIRPDGRLYVAVSAFTSRATPTGIQGYGDLLQLSPEGQLGWLTRVGETATYEELLDVVVTPSGGALAVGYSDETPVGSLSVRGRGLTLRMHADGNSDETNGPAGARRVRIGTSPVTRYHAAAYGPGGGLYLAGAHGELDDMGARLRPALTLPSGVVVSESPATTGALHTLDVGADGWLRAGLDYEDRTSTGGAYCGVQRFTTAGVYSSSQGTGRGCRFIGAAVDPDGRMFVVGTRTPNPADGVQEFMMLRYRPSGPLESPQTFVAVPGFSSLRPGGLVVLPDGGVLLAAGATQECGFRCVRYAGVLVRFRADGRVDSSFGTNGVQLWGEAEGALFHDVAIAPDGRVVVAGSVGYGSTAAPYVQAAVLRLHLPEATGLSDSATPRGLDLSPPVPNPSRGLATVRYSLRGPGPVRLVLLDVLGREVAVLADGDRPAGAHTVPLDVGRLAPGAYLVRLEAGSDVVARRVTVAR